LVTGEAETHYDKIHLFDALGYAESRQILPGDSPVHFPLSGHRIGLATCYDLRFPSLFTHLARSGAELILVPASWAPGDQKLHQWRTLVTARAMDSTTFVVAVDQAAPPAVSEGPGPTGIGHSMVVDPTGTVLLELGEDPELALVELDLGTVADARRRLPVLDHARAFD
ncbi:MAG: nitrilase-related carbon-nitrogen hydrolase, partial [Propionicimonas sp.]